MFKIVLDEKHILINLMDLETTIPDNKQMNKNNKNIEQIASLSKLGFALCLTLLFFIVPLAYKYGDPLFDDLYYHPKFTALLALVRLSLFFAVAGIAFGALKPFGRNEVDIPAVLFIAALILSTIFSVAPRLSFYGAFKRNDGLISNISYLGLFLICAHFVTAVKLVKTLIISALASASAASIYGILQFFDIEFLRRDYIRINWWRSFAASGNPNFLSAYLLLVIPVALSLVLCEKIEKKKRLLAGAVFIITTTCLITTYTRAGFLGYVVGVSVFFIISGYTFAKFKQHIRTIAIFLIILIGVVFLVDLSGRKLHNQSLAGRIETALETESLDKDSGAVRLFVWRNSVPLVLERPVFGWGLENFVKAFYQKGRKLDKSGFEGKIHNVVDRAENTFIQTAVTTGLAGLAAFLAIIILFFTRTYHAIKRMEDSFLRSLLIGICAGWWGHLVHQFFSFSTISAAPTFWGLGGLALAIISISISKPAQTDLP
ncbi:MAG: O-antigen ligase family protein [Planctomycetota bacterium]